MVTSVWLFKPRSHGRKREGTRARNGAPLPGRHPVFACPIDRRLRLCARVGTQHLFVVACRRSCVVPDASGARRRCFRRRRYGARGAAACRWRARAVLPVAAGAAAAACVLRLSRWRARVAWRVRAWRLRGARAGRDGGVRLASCRMCGRVCAGSPVPVLEMSSMSPQAVGAAVTALPPWRAERVHGVAGGPRGTAGRGAAAVLAWRWR